MSRPTELRRCRIAFFRGPHPRHGDHKSTQRTRSRAMAEALRRSGAAGLVDMSDGSGFVLLAEPADVLPTQVFIDRVPEVDLVETVEIDVEATSPIAVVCANPSLLQGPDAASRQVRRQLAASVYAKLRARNLHRRFPVLKSFQHGHPVVALSDVPRTIGLVHR